MLKGTVEGRNCCVSQSDETGIEQNRKKSNTKSFDGSNLFRLKRKQSAGKTWIESSFKNVLPST